MIKILSFVSLFLFSVCSVSAQGSLVSLYDNYKEAASVEEALAFFADNYRLYFGEKEGEGMSKAQAAPLLEWDFALHAVINSKSTRIDGSTVIVEIHEENDFTKAIGFPGWEATVRYTFNGEGKIEEQIFTPQAGQPDYHSYLRPAVKWLEEHYPEKLAEVYENGQLKQYNGAAAMRWMELFYLWENKIVPQKED